MIRTPGRSLPALILALGMLTAWGCGCGEDGGFHPPDSDVETDGEDVAGDVTEDQPPDGVEDVPVDGDEDVPTDTEEDDGGGDRGHTPFEAETAGGARVTSENYTIELFIAPVRPVGEASSSNYNVKLGPAGIRSH